MSKRFWYDDNYNLQSIDEEEYADLMRIKAEIDKEDEEYYGGEDNDWEDALLHWVHKDKIICFGSCNGGYKMMNYVNLDVNTAMYKFSGCSFDDFKEMVKQYYIKTIGEEEFNELTSTTNNCEIVEEDDADLSLWNFCKKYNISLIDFYEYICNDYFNGNCFVGKMIWKKHTLWLKYWQ